ncbi:uncharacterized protein [Chironomus tepperi]|uniref:uncharacterized protein n=1 Tax=Chironomus tepperi TaxID=113505 RepID=UPI00391F801F
MAKNKTQSNGNQKFNKINQNKVKNRDFGPKKTQKLSKNNVQKGKNDSNLREDNKKINYVLHPRLLTKKQKDVKENERREKEKSFQVKKRKRNAIFMKTTDKGQPKLNARMKILYDQIARSCEKT